MSAQPRWEQSEERFRPAEVPAQGTLADQDRNAAAIVTVIAMASIASGAINIAAAASIPGLNGQSLAFFWTIGITQVVWGLVTLVWAPRWWLALGALGNAVVAATWLVSRTVALPFGQFAHVVLPARFADALAQILAVVVVIGAAWLAVRGSAPARSASRVRGFALAAAIVIGALGVAGVISQANAFASGAAEAAVRTARPHPTVGAAVEAVTAAAVVVGLRLLTPPARQRKVASGARPDPAERRASTRSSG